ncbi:hypothetical protein WR25_14970 [Diploscapter pachys]|uniref:NR LBD domain-containing protein n=1 Tax=Diploscapter pachys TaxID=2018661 RepID=A0A2A2LS42_9BILA|nr:hypothetical protein WR25_14970 [Diploscapter pachys]
MRCVKAGMKEEQVQNERDIIGKRVRTNSGTSANYNGRTSSGSLKRHQSCEDGQVSKRSSPEMATDDPWSDHESLIEALLLSENTIQNLRDTVIKQTGSVEYSTQPEQSGEDKGRIASINDIFKSLHSQLLLVIEWAKTLPPFTKLSTEDQTILLKNFASQHIVLCVSYRSKDAPDFLKLINDSLIPRASSLMDEKQTGLYYLRDCEKVMDEMVAPMRYLKMDDSEFVAIKACVLFNPVAKGLSAESVAYIMETRRRIFAALQHYVQTNKPEDKTRIGDLLLFTLGPLSSLANSFSEDVMVTNLIGAARIDQLMAELILADSEEPRCGQKRDLLVCNDALNQQPHSVASSGFPCFSPSPHNPSADFQLQSADNSLHPILPPSTESLPLTTDDASFDSCNAFGTYNIFEK